MVSVDLNYVAGLDAADSRPPSSLFAADSRPQSSLSEYRMGHVEESMQMAAQAIKSKPEGKVRLGTVMPKAKTNIIFPDGETSDASSNRGRGNVADENMVWKGDSDKDDDVLKNLNCERERCDELEEKVECLQRDLAHLNQDRQELLMEREEQNRERLHYMEEHKRLALNFEQVRNQVRQYAEHSGLQG
jgi:chromosome segregation ATPase